MAVPERMVDREKPELAIIIVNWNSGRQLSVCLESIRAADKHGFILSQVVVVDNGSRDGSADDLEDLDLPLLLIRNPANNGFGAACNQGAEKSTSDFILFLNPDTRLEADSLCKPLNFLNSAAGEKIGIVGIQLYDESGKVSRSCSRFPTPLNLIASAIGVGKFAPGPVTSQSMAEWDHKESRIVDQVMGAFFLVRAKLIRQLSGFDERFFVYFEEVDFSKRAYDEGWRSYFLAEARAFHKGGGASQQIKARRLFYSLRSRIQYAYKHFGWFPATAVALGTLLVEPFPRLIQAALALSWTQAVDTVRAYVLLWREIPSLLAGGRTAKRVS